MFSLLSMVITHFSFSSSLASASIHQGLLISTLGLGNFAINNISNKGAIDK